MISVLIPVYNTHIEYLEQCLDSIDQQTFDGYEIVIVNDGSNITVSGFLERYQFKNSNRQYQLINQEHTGISKALNHGLTKCSFDIVARMDGDDIMFPDRLEKQYKYFTSNTVDILGCQMQLFGDLNFTTNHPPAIPSNIINYIDWFINHPSVMYRKSTILEIGGYNTDYDGCEDLELWCRSLKNNLIIKNMPEVLLYHRRHNSNATVTHNRQHISNKISHIKSLYA